MVIFHSYVSLPEGRSWYTWWYIQLVSDTSFSCCVFLWPGVSECVFWCLSRDCLQLSWFSPRWTRTCHIQTTLQGSMIPFEFKGWTSIFPSDLGFSKCRSQEPHDVRGGDFPDPGETYGWAWNPGDCCWGLNPNWHSMLKYVPSGYD